MAEDRTFALVAFTGRIHRSHSPVAFTGRIHRSHSPVASHSRHSHHIRAGRIHRSHRIRVIPIAFTPFAAGPEPFHQEDRTFAPFAAGPEPFQQEGMCPIKAERVPSRPNSHQVRTRGKAQPGISG